LTAPNISRKRAEPGLIDIDKREVEHTGLEPAVLLQYPPAAAAGGLLGVERNSAVARPLLRSS
jgi:hypothetical protein